MLQNMTHQVIQILHSMLELIFWICCFCITFLYFSIYSIYYDLTKQYIHRFSLSLFYPEDWGSGVLLFLKFINIVSVHLFYNFIELVILFYTFLVIHFARYKEYMISRFSFSNFSAVLPDFIYVRAIGNLWSICLEVNILSCLWSETLATIG